MIKDIEGLNNTFEMANFMCQIDWAEGCPGCEGVSGRDLYLIL